MKHILKCISCGEYGLTESCTCDGKKLRQIPLKYSPEDKYGKYRREYKKQKGLL